VLLKFKKSPEGEPRPGWFFPDFPRVVLLAERLPETAKQPGFNEHTNYMGVLIL
jgi:hypothetical protein